MRVWRSWSVMSRNSHRSTMQQTCLIWRRSKQESVGWSIQNWIWRRWEWIGIRNSWWSAESKLILPTSWKLYPKQQNSQLWRGQIASEQMVPEIAGNFVQVLILKYESFAPIPKRLRFPHPAILKCSQLTDDRAVCAPLQCPVYSWKSHSPWPYRSFVCNWLVERKQLVVLTVATTALIDVVEQSHYGSAILWLMWAERSSENLIDCPHVWKTVLL